MCVYSMIADHYRDKFTGPINPWPNYIPNGIPASPSQVLELSPVTRTEFEDLKRTVLEMKELLLRAKRYDEETGQRDCEMEDKVALIRKIAELVGVDLGEAAPTSK